MKRLFIMTWLIISAMAASAQTNLLSEEPADQVEVIGFFCKNDTMKYLRRDVSYSIENNDTTITSDYEQEFMITVTDSTKNGYTMKYELLSSTLNKAKGDFERIIHETATEALGNCPCIFTTNEYGELQHIKNWRDIRNAVKKITATALDRWFTETPGLDSIMNRATLESSISVAFSTEDGVKESYDELDLLFGLHGSAFDIDIIENETTNNGFPAHTWLEAGYTVKEDEYDDDDDDDYAVRFKEETHIPMEDLADLSTDMMVTMMSDNVADTIKEGMGNAFSEIKEQYPEVLKTDIMSVTFSYNGWPKTATKVTDIKQARHDITVTDITWTYRSWENY